MTLKHAIEWAALEREVKDLGKSVEESAALKQTYEKLRELDQVKTTFLSSVSHELRTPLTSIMGFSEISRTKLNKVISDNVADPKIIKNIQQIENNLEIIVSESERLEGLIESILDLTAMEAGTAQWRWEPLSLREVIEDSAAEFAPMFIEKGLEFVVEIKADLPLIKGDRYRISQVIKQLLCNAVAFTDQGRVRCIAKNIDNHIVLDIDDTGRGIPASQQGMIFEKFSQIGDTLTGKPKGVGLGLPICKLIVEYHGGRLTVASEPDKGSIFTISLPCSEEVSA